MEPWREAVGKSALEAKSRILDRGRPFQPLEEIRTHGEEAKKPIF